MPKDAGEPEWRRKVGRHIEAARQKAGLTQTELAQKIGVKNQTVCDYEAGRSLPSLPRLRQIARVTRESASFFMADRLGKKDSLERLSRDLGLLLGQRRLALVLEALPPEALRREIDAIIGRAASEPHGQRSTRKR